MARWTAPQVSFGGLRPEDIQLFAVYVDAPTLTEEPDLYLPPADADALLRPGPPGPVKNTQRFPY